MAALKLEFYNRFKVTMQIIVGNLSAYLVDFHARQLIFSEK